MENALPYDEVAEDVVLGSVIAHPEEYTEVARYLTNIDVLYQNKARLLWRRIQEMSRNGQKIDTITVCSSITKKDIDKGLTKYYITGCTSEPALKGMASFYANQLYEKYLMRKIIVKADEIKNNATDNSKDIYKCEDNLPICKDCYIDAFHLHIDLEIEDLL